MGEQDAATVVADTTSRDVVALDDGKTAAWIVALPLALLAVPLIALLAKPVGTLLDPQVKTTELLPWALRYFRPKPGEQGLYLLSLAVPVVLSVAVLAATGRIVTAPPRVARVLPLLAKMALGLVLVACVVAQYHLHYEWTQGPPSYRFFAPATLIAGALVAAAIVAATRSSAVRRQIAVPARDSRALRIGALMLAASITAVWMLHAIQTDSSVAWASGAVVAHLPYTSDETFAVINGLSPFVDSSPLYATLWPYVAAPPLVAFGKTLLVFTITMSTITALALLAAFGILRRATGSSVSALLLYLPFLATSLFIFAGHPANSLTPANSLADFPLRYAGPLLLAWLTARELDQPRQRALWPLFTAAGLVLLNNVGVGLPALGATLVAVAASGPWTRRSSLALARGAASGLLLAIAAVTLVTLAHAGELPRFGQLSEFSRLYLAGYGATPLHSVLGLHLAIYLTYVAAIATAAVRVRGRAAGRVLTGMLLWNGIFGLGALSYFVAESGPLWLLASFSTWALTVMLLTVLVVRRLASRAAPWPDLADLAVLLGAGVMVCSLAQFPTPWSQIERLTADHRGTQPVAAEVEPFVPDPKARSFVASLADGRRFYLKRGAPVALLFENSHRVADAYGVVNVSPYANTYEIIARASLRRVVDTLRRAGGNTVVTPLIQEPASDVNATLISLGFGILTAKGIVKVTAGVNATTTTVRGQTLVKWVDRRNLHPRALRNGRGTLVARMPLRAG
ncbi:MAG TPA: hypothetical protein VFF79_07290 [Conexibacter sp.]|nr:hypothetical protein [Conexibacter sp.]